MDNIQISKNHNSKQFVVNNEIEEVLSGDSRDKTIQIKKISHVENNENTNLQDKIEMSSNKDVTIGLELLVNKDKIIDTKEEINNKPIDLNNTENIVDLNSAAEIDFNVMMSDDNKNNTIDNELNIDRTSRLSQSEIDAFIDSNDAKAGPHLVNDAEIEELNEAHISNKKTTDTSRWILLRAQ